MCVSNTKLIEFVSGINAVAVDKGEDLIVVVHDDRVHALDPHCIDLIGPSNKIHFSAGRSSSEHCFKIVDKIPSFHSKGDGQIIGTV